MRDLGVANACIARNLNRCDHQLGISCKNKTKYWNLACFGWFAACECVLSLGSGTVFITYRGQCVRESRLNFHIELWMCEAPNSLAQRASIPFWNLHLELHLHPFHLLNTIFCLPIFSCPRLNTRQSSEHKQKHFPPEATGAVTENVGNRACACILYADTLLSKYQPWSTIWPFSRSLAVLCEYSNLWVYPQYIATKWVVCLLFAPFKWPFDLPFVDICHMCIVYDVKLWIGGEFWLWKNVAGHQKIHHRLPIPLWWTRLPKSGSCRRSGKCYIILDVQCLVGCTIFRCNRCPIDTLLHFHRCRVHSYRWNLQEQIGDPIGRK